MQQRKLVAEALGTALLMIVAVGTATAMFGFQLAGTSVSAGVVTTALAFGFVLLALAYTLGPVSGCHINPAVTAGFLVSGRMKLNETIGYWVAQLAGGVLGAITLWAILSGSPAYAPSEQGLGANGYGESSMIGLNAGGAFVAEVVLTFVFVLVVLCATSRLGSPGFAGLAIGLALAMVHFVGIPLTGTSVNPARSLGSAVIVGGDALKQLWLFIVAPLVGGGLAALVYRFLIPDDEPIEPKTVIDDRRVARTPATP